MFSNVQSIFFFTPELLLAAASVILMLLSLARSAISKRYAPWIAAAGLTACALATLSCPFSSQMSLFGNLLNLDSFAAFFKAVFLVAAFIIVVFSANSKELVKDQSEYFALLLGLVLGAILLSSTTNLLVVYLSLEFVGLMSYLLVGYNEGARSKEAALKYVLYGAVASGVFLYGASLYYGITGSLYITETAAPATGNLFIVASFLMLAGFLFKLAAVPMHAWCPDAYEGAPTPVAALLSVVPKTAGLAVLMRMTYAIGASAGWPTTVAIISAATMTFGNLAAIPQTNLKRLFAYSSIAHAGYMLMGIASASSRGNEAVYFYIIAYLVMNLGAFLVVQIVADETGSEEIGAYRGLARRGPYGTAVSICMVVFLLSLTGIPPFVGFIGKFYIFTAVIDSKLYWLAIVGILNSVVSLYYYMRIAKEMFLRPPDNSSPICIHGRPLALTLVLLALSTLALGLCFGIVDFGRLHL